MGNDIECNRAAITLFNLCKWNHVRSYKRSCSSILEILLTNFTCTFLVASLIVLQRVNSNIDIVFLHFTLIIGNVEVNPGPLTNEISNASLINTDKSLDMCNINIRSIRNKLEYEFQSEFLPKHSTVHQLHGMYNSILISLERKEMSCFAFVIFQKRSTRYGIVVYYTS